MWTSEEEHLQERVILEITQAIRPRDILQIRAHKEQEALLGRKSYRLPNFKNVVRQALQPYSSYLDYNLKPSGPHNIA